MNKPIRECGEMADTRDLKSLDESRAGSSPATRNLSFSPAKLWIEGCLIGEVKNYQVEILERVAENDYRPMVYPRIIKLEPAKLSWTFKKKYPTSKIAKKAFNLMYKRLTGRMGRKFGVTHGTRRVVQCLVQNPTNIGKVLMMLFVWSLKR